MNFYDLSDGFSRSCMRLEYEILFMDLNFQFSKIFRYILSKNCDWERSLTVYLITFYYDQIVI